MRVNVTPGIEVLGTRVAFLAKPLPVRKERHYISFVHTELNSDEDAVIFFLLYDVCKNAGNS